jgi:hypothetical protein
MRGTGWKLKLSRMFSATTVFSYALSPIGHCLLANDDHLPFIICNLLVIVFVCLSCDRDTAHLVAPFLYLLLGAQSPPSRGDRRLFPVQVELCKPMAVMLGHSTLDTRHSTAVGIIGSERPAVPAPMQHRECPLWGFCRP